MVYFDEKRGQYVVQIYGRREVDPVTNKTRRPKQCHFFDKKRDAERAEHALKTEVAQYGGKLPGTETVGAYLDTWLETTVAPPNLRPKTYAAYAGYVKVYLRPALGHIRLDHLSKDDVQRMLNALLNRPGKRGKPLSPNYVAHIRAVLVIALNHAVRDEKVRRNVASLTRAPKGEPPKSSRLDHDGGRRLLAALPGETYGPAIMTALYLGLRIGEVLGLQGNDFGPARRVVHIQRQLDYVDGQWALVPLKTRSSDRHVDVPAALVRALAAHEMSQKARIATAQQAGQLWPASDLVFRNRRGLPVDDETVRCAFKRILVKAGLPADLRLHDLRHTYATLALADPTADYRAVQKSLGHSKLSMTVDRYGDVLPVTRRKVADALERALAVGD